MRNRKWWWRIFVGASTLLTILAATVLVADYRRTLRLRDNVGTLETGTSENDILNVLGPPNSVGTGSRTDPSSGQTVSGYAVWTYCSNFDWDGQRSRWNDQTFIPYWMSRLNPTIDCEHDAVIELWLRNGKLDAIENSVIDNLIGRNPTISL
jgi:hypothetical protein